MNLKLNAKDVTAGLLLILLAVAGLWLNSDYTLGTARRMGPGYMPMLVFYLTVFLGLVVLVLGLFNGPDPLEKWTGLDAGTLVLSIAIGYGAYLVAPHLGGFFGGNSYNAMGLGLLLGFLVMAISMGWRVLAVISAALCAFSLLLEQGGLVLAIAATVAISAFADKSQRVLGVIGCMVFLVVLCWWVFIYELDIRIPVFPQF